MLYQYLQNSYFKKSFDLEARIQKRNNIAKSTEGTNFCFVVVEYPGGQLSYGNYQLLCVSSKLNLRTLYEYILRKMNKSQCNFFFTVRGSIRNLGDNIGVLFSTYKEQDGFVYIFMRTENTF